MRAPNMNKLLWVLFIGLALVLTVPAMCIANEPQQPEIALDYTLLVEGENPEPEAAPEFILMTEGENPQPEVAPDFILLTEGEDPQPEVAPVEPGDANVPNPEAV